jgi:hypothetical protein
MTALGNTDDMPMDSKKYWAAATRGEVAGVALRASSGLMNMKWALEKLAKGEIDITNELEQIDRNVRDLDVMFDELTGYTSDAGG